MPRNGKKFQTGWFQTNNQISWVWFPDGIHFKLILEVQRRVLRLHLQQMPEQGTQKWWRCEPPGVGKRCVPGVCDSDPGGPVDPTIFWSGMRVYHMNFWYIACSYVYGGYEIICIICCSHSSGDNPIAELKGRLYTRRRTHTETKTAWNWWLSGKWRSWACTVQSHSTLRLSGFDVSFPCFLLLVEKGNGFSPSCIAESALKYPWNSMKMAVLIGKSTINRGL